MRIIKVLSLALIALFCSMAVTAKNSDKMNFKLAKDGKVSVYFNGKEFVQPSNIGLIVKDQTIFQPVSAEQKGDNIFVKYENGTDVTLQKIVRHDGSVRLEVTSISNDVDAFIFGPFECPDAIDAGEYLGAAWRKDSSLVCIQGLNPKTLGGCLVLKPGETNNESDFKGCLRIIYTNEPDFTLPDRYAAGMSNGKCLLSCKAFNMAKPYVINSMNGFKNVNIPALPGDKGKIEGAAIVLTCANNSKDLLNRISQIEIEEGLPHPMIDGEWAKTSPHTNDIYFVVEGGTMDSQIRIAEKAGVQWIYFSNPFESWGNFNISKTLYPGGEEQFHNDIKKAHDKGINIGFHTLTNFVTTNDPYVTPVPDKNLLAFDPVEITSSISDTDTTIFIAEKLNYDLKFHLRTVRIGDELIKFSGFDSDRNCLVSCERGAFGTHAVNHEKGEIITHLDDTGYGTFLANEILQIQMAERIGCLMKDHDIRRMSFDGLEGARSAGYGRFSEIEFVNKVFQSAGNNLICDASVSTHLGWHAVSYYNWGEPWYDYQRKGGMYNYRVRNLDKFERNLLPNMLGWYSIFNNKERAEATTPEIIEFILSRTIAFNAGLCLHISLEESDKLDSFLELVKLWQRFKHEVDVPKDIREKMKDENSSWHLENKDGKWYLSEMVIADYDMTYCDNYVLTESRTTGYQSTEDDMKQTAHRSNIIIDRSTPVKNAPYITEPFHCRIRVGTPMDKCKLCNLSFSPPWFGSRRLLSFKVVAGAGEYLEYNGGTTLYRYDRDYNLIEKIEGEGDELVVNGKDLTGFTVNYDIIDEVEGAIPMAPMLKYIRTRTVYEF